MLEFRGVIADHRGPGGAAEGNTLAQAILIARAVAVVERAIEGEILDARVADIQLRRPGLLATLALIRGVNDHRGDHPGGLDDAIADVGHLVAAVHVQFFALEGQTDVEVMLRLVDDPKIARQNLLCGATCHRLVGIRRPAVGADETAHSGHDPRRGIDVEDHLPVAGDIRPGVLIAEATEGHQLVAHLGLEMTGVGPDRGIADLLVKTADLIVGLLGPDQEGRLAGGVERERLQLIPVTVNVAGIIAVGLVVDDGELQLGVPHGVLQG